MFREILSKALKMRHHHLFIIIWIHIYKHSEIIGMTLILCIEDDPATLDDIAEELEERGFDVLTATDGRDGLNKILKHEPDVVISDVTMPNMSGPELLEELQTKYKKFDNLLFIFLSARTSEQDIMDGLKHGAHDYLLKPIDFGQLERTINAILKHINSIRENGAFPVNVGDKTFL